MRARMVVWSLDILPNRLRCFRRSVEGAHGAPTRALFEDAIDGCRPHGGARSAEARAPRYLGALDGRSKQGARMAAPRREAFALRERRRHRLGAFWKWSGELTGAVVASPWWRGCRRRRTVGAV